MTRTFGFLDADLRVDFVQGVEGSPVWYIEGIYVVPAHRGRGVGRYLCSVLEAHAASEGRSAIASDCELDDTESEAFHNAVGFTEAIRSIHLVKQIECAPQSLFDLVGRESAITDGRKGQDESRTLTDLNVRPWCADDEAWTNSAFDRHWAEPSVAMRGCVINLATTEMKVACVGSDVVGVVNYIFDNDNCKIVSIISELPNRGVGRRLVEEVGRDALATRCPLMTTVTTNDNTDALRLWQKQGFTIVEISRDAVTEARNHLKPAIPSVGQAGIPIRDEIMLQKVLNAVE